MVEMFEPTVSEQIAELKRELAMRLRLYPQWVESGRMAQVTADRQLARLVAAVQTLSKIQKAA
jgi:hypothetical protein